MENLDVKQLYHNLLVGLVAVEDYTIDYYAMNKNIRRLVMDWLQLTSLKTKITKSVLFEALDKMNLQNLPEAKGMLIANYENMDYIESIYTDYSSSFSELTEIEKKVLVAIDLTGSSILKEVFQSSRVPFYPADVYTLLCYALGLSEQEITEAMAELIRVGFVDYNDSEKYFDTTNVFLAELYRVSTIPLDMKIIDLNDFDLNCSEGINLSVGDSLLTFSGGFITSYLFTMFENEKKSFWYSTNTIDAIEQLNFIMDANIINQYIWIDNYEAEQFERQADLLNLVEITHSILIVSAIKAEAIFGKMCIKVYLKDSCLENSMNKMFSANLAAAVKTYLAKFVSADKKRGFISEVSQFIGNSNDDYVIEILPELYNMFKMSLSNDELEQQKSLLVAFDEAEFEQRYGVDNLNFGNPDINPVIRDIHRKLMAPCDYLRANKDVYSRVKDIIDQHPNIINKELLLAIMQVSLYLSKDNKIHFPKPIILVGSPGCGKSMLCRQLREAFGQERDIFIPIGTGLGADSLMGITPSYKNAGPGRVLSSIWESMGESKKNCLNPLLVLDEIEKGCYSLKNDVNQNIQPSLLQLFSDECALHFQDSFFQISIKNFFANYIATANSLAPLPEPILNRCFIVRFRNYDECEMKNIVIPALYSSFRKELNHLVPESLTKDEIDLIYQMSNGQPRQVKPSLILWLASIFKDGKRQELDLKTINSLVESSRMNYDDKQIGFYR